MHPLGERIEQRQLHRRLRDLQRNAGEARAAADVDDALILKVHGLQQRDGVEKMQLCYGLRLGDGGQVHDLILLYHGPGKGAELLLPLLGQGQAQSSQAFFQRGFHHP